MQKLSGKIMVMLYKSCSVLHKESKKLGMHFYDFFYDFLCILQESAKLQTLFKNQFSNRPLGSFQIHKYTLALQISPWKEVSPCNWAVRHRPAALRPNFGEPAAVAGQARAEGGLRVS
jgi:hypothetical protein